MSLVAVGCVQDWGDDHQAVNKLEVLGASDSWIQIRDIPATAIDCSFTGCQNIVRGVHYEVVGEADEAKDAALSDLLERWVPSTETDPFGQDSVHFQLRSDIEIDTTTGTAFLRASFDENLQVGDGDFIANVIIITLSSDDQI